MHLRFLRASAYAESMEMPLVFVLLGKPWALAGVGGIFVPLRSDQAIVLSEWTRYGELPEVVWGQVVGR